MGRQEQVGAVPVDLGALGFAERIFDRQLVQPELGSDDGQLLIVWPAQIEPDDAVGIVVEMVGDLL